MSKFAPISAPVVPTVRFSLDDVVIATLTEEQAQQLYGFAVALLNGTAPTVFTKTVADVETEAPKEPAKAPKETSTKSGKPKASAPKEHTEVRLYLVRDGKFVGVSTDKDAYKHPTCKERLVVQSLLSTEGAKHSKERNAGTQPSYEFGSAQKATAFCKKHTDGFVVTSEDLQSYYDRKKH